MKIKWFIAGAIAVALLQTAALGKIIYDRATLLENGREVTLQSGMVDPRDLFRGHYVVLNLTIGRMLDDQVTTVGKFERNQKVWVSLQKGEDEFWVGKTLYSEFPEGIGEPIIHGKYLSGRRVSGQSTRTHRIRFPIDRFFAEKTRAKDLEKVRRDRKLGVVVALDENGGAAIKGISVEGELIYNEPLW